ncbi:AP-3 complex subunit sigma-1 isoform 1-T1 [Xenentodon cancila]
MIKAILIFNNHGKPRLSKFYEHYNEDTEQQIIRETFHLVSKRDENVCNFLEGGMLIGGSDYKLIYRHYATLYFVFCVDSSESELGILDLIQVFVETLDKCFENVCELDLIFHVDKVHNILAEMVMGGMVLETNMNEIITQVDAQNKMEKSEFFPFFSLFTDVYLSVYQAGQVDTGRHCRSACSCRISCKEHEPPGNAQKHQHW